MTTAPRRRGSLISALVAAALACLAPFAGASAQGTARPAAPQGANPADDRAACTAGIAAIEAALRRNPPSADRGRLERALRVGRREQGEREYDECVEAIGEVRGLLGGG